MQFVSAEMNTPHPPRNQAIPAVWLMLRLRGPDNHSCSFLCPSCGAEHVFTFDFPQGRLIFPQKLTLPCVSCGCLLTIHVEGFAGDPADQPVVNTITGRKYAAGLERALQQPSALAPRQAVSFDIQQTQSHQPAPPQLPHVSAGYKAPPAAPSSLPAALRWLKRFI